MKPSTAIIALCVTMGLFGCISNKGSVLKLDHAEEALTPPPLPEVPRTHIRDFLDPFWDDLSNWPAEISNGHYRYRLHVRRYEGGQSASYQISDDELARLRKDMGWHDDMDEDEFPWSFARFNFGPTYGWSAADQSVVRRGVDHPEVQANHFYAPDGTRMRSIFTVFEENRWVSVLYDRRGEIVGFCEGAYYDHLAYEGREVTVVRGRAVPRREFSRILTMPWSEYREWLDTFEGDHARRRSHETGQPSEITR